MPIRYLQLLCSAVPDASSSGHLAIKKNGPSTPGWLMNKISFHNDLRFKYICQITVKTSFVSLTSPWLGGFQQKDIQRRFVCIEIQESWSIFIPITTNLKMHINFAKFNVFETYLPTYNSYILFNTTQHKYGKSYK